MTLCQRFGDEAHVVVRGGFDGDAQGVVKGLQPVFDLAGSGWEGKVISSVCQLHTTSWSLATSTPRVIFVTNFATIVSAVVVP